MLQPLRQGPVREFVKTQAPRPVRVHCAQYGARIIHFDAPPSQLREGRLDLVDLEVLVACVAAARVELLEEAKELEVARQVQQQQPELLAAPDRVVASCRLGFLRALGDLEGAHDRRLGGKERFEAQRFDDACINLCQRQLAVAVAVEGLEQLLTLSPRCFVLASRQLGERLERFGKRHRRMHIDDSDAWDGRFGHVCKVDNLAGQLRDTLQNCDAL